MCLPLFLSNNIPPKQFVDPDLSDRIRSVLEQTKLEPSALELEIVETVAMGEPEASGKILAKLKALGVRLSIDDFGIGYCSLSRLQTLPVDGLKIDRSFIQEIGRDSTMQDVVQTIVHLAHAVRLHVVAEGVEVESEALLLKRLRCEFAQGFFFARPADADSISAAIAGRSLGIDTPDSCLSLSRPLRKA